MTDSLSVASLHINSNIAPTESPSANESGPLNSTTNGSASLDCLPNNGSESMYCTASTTTNQKATDRKEEDQPRVGYIDWDEYFMAVSFLSAQRSKDPATQVGACIVGPDRRIVGIGYNGMPRGCPDSQLPWGKTSPDELDNKYMYVCHAEMNAILNKNSASVEGCTMYVALFPCNECAKMIVQSGIRQIIYFSDKHKDKKSTIASKRLLDVAGIGYSQFVPRMRQLTIDFHGADPSVFGGSEEES